MTHFFRHSFATACILLATVAAAQTGPDDAAVQFRFYGHLNPAIQSYDDGFQSTSTLVDSSAAPSRIGFYLDSDVQSGSLTFNFETALGLRQSSGVAQGFAPDAFNPKKTDLRKLEVIWTSDYGTVSLGQGSMATDNITEATQSGATLAVSVTPADFAGGFFFRDTGGALTSVRVGQVFDSKDGGRRARLRYDTPSFSGFTISVAAGTEVLNNAADDDYFDAGIRYAGDAGGAKVLARLGYQYVRRSGGSMRERTLAGSASVLFENGFNASVASGVGLGDSASYLFGQVGYRGDVFSVGETAISLVAQGSDDIFMVGGRSTNVGLGVSQTFDAPNIEAYVGINQFSYRDPTPVQYADGRAVFVGALWKF